MTARLKEALMMNIFTDKLAENYNSDNLLEMIKTFDRKLVVDEYDYVIGDGNYVLKATEKAVEDIKDFYIDSKTDFTE